MKKILYWSAIAFGSFLLLVVIIFMILTYLNPVDEELAVTISNGDTVLAKELINQKQKEIDQLYGEIDSLKTVIFSLTSVRDSLIEQTDFKDGVIREYQKTVETINGELANLNHSSMNVKDLAKTYESMKVDEMRPILSNLDDQTVIQLYRNISSRNRKNLLMALSSQRAALITEQIAKTPES